MKEKIVIIAAVLVLCSMSGIYFFQTHRQAATPEEAVLQSGRHADAVIYRKGIKNGAIVFFKSNVGNNQYALNAGFVKKSLLGWKWVWGGGFSEEDEQYFPSAEGTPFPLLFGQISDKTISRVEVNDKTHNYAESAEIEGSGDDKIWFVLPKEDVGPDFDIVWLSDDGAVFKTESVNVIETSCYTK